MKMEINTVNRSLMVIKLGGSLIDNSKELLKIIIKYSNENKKTILIIPGGSIFADLVKTLKASDEASHWMAILGMEQYGYYLNDGNEAKLLDNLELKGYGTFVFLPYNFMKQNDELQHSWNVTSDTIAAWIAKKLNAKFIKVTNVDGIYINEILKKEVYASEIIGIRTCVDAELPYFLIKNKMNCRVINGKYPEKFIYALENISVGTVIKG